MSIQSEINQAISVMGLILPQTAYGQNLQTKRKIKQATKEVEAASDLLDAVGENPKIPPQEFANLGKGLLNKTRDALLLDPKNEKLAKEYGETADFIDTMQDIADLEASEKRTKLFGKKDKKPKVEEPKTTITPAATAKPAAEPKPAAEKKPIEEKKPAPQTSSFEKKLTGYNKELYNKQYNEALERRKQEMNRMQSNTNRVTTLTAKPAPVTTPAPTAPAAKPAPAPIANKPAPAKSTAPQPISPKPTQSAAQQKLNNSFANSFNEALARAQKIQAGGKK